MGSPRHHGPARKLPVGFQGWWSHAAHHDDMHQGSHGCRQEPRGVGVPLPAPSLTCWALLGLALFACAGPSATVVPADSDITLAPGQRAQLAGSDLVVT